MERYVANGKWDVARWMELIPTGGALLEPRHEAALASREEESENKARKGFSTSTSSGSRGRPGAAPPGDAPTKDEDDGDGRPGGRGVLRVASKKWS